MFPLKDDNPTRRPPVLTIALIALNVAVFLFEVASPRALTTALIEGLGLVPARLGNGEWGWSFLTLITSQFLHGSPLHLGGNMLFLWIFGNNVEDHLGRLLFLPFYLACGVAAGLVQAAATPLSPVPTIGASGAIAGILGAYLVLYPRARVYTLILIPFIFPVVALPAALWLGIWFVMQVLFGLLSIGREGGIAWFAHAGGFLFGMLVIRATRVRRGERYAYPEFDGRAWWG